MIRTSVRESLRQLREAKGAAIVAVLLVTMASSLAGVLTAAHDWVEHRLLDDRRPSLMIAVVRTPSDSAPLETALHERFPRIDTLVLAPSAVRDDLATWFPDIADVVTALDDASFPPLLQAEVPTENDAEVRGWLAARPEVTLVASSRSWQQRLRQAVRRVAFGGFILTSSLLLGCCAVVVLVVRLLVLTHADEIAIMRLIGARERDIRLPYLISGALLGLSGAAIGLLIIIAVVAAARNTLPELRMSTGTLAPIPLAGALVGLLGAAVGLAALPREP